MKQQTCVYVYRFFVVFSWASSQSHSLLLRDSRGLHRTKKKFQRFLLLFDLRLKMCASLPLFLKRTKKLQALFPNLALEKLCAVISVWVF